MRILRFEHRRHFVTFSEILGIASNREVIFYLLLHYYHYILHYHQHDKTQTKSVALRFKTIAAYQPFTFVSGK